MRVVIDTNLWLSGLMLPLSVPGRLIRAVVAGQIAAVSSEPLLTEIGVALQYPKVRRRIPLTDELLRRFVAELRYVTEVVAIDGVTAEVPADRRDDFILATFIASDADYLISGDADLTALRPRFAVVTAREFCDQHLR
jgi:uncharacterized protein